MSKFTKQMYCAGLIDDATKRLGDRVVSMILSGELVVEDDYVQSQVRFIKKISEGMKED